MFYKSVILYRYIYMLFHVNLYVKQRQEYIVLICLYKYV